MENEMMTYDEKANTDKLEFYCNEKIKAHIILKKKKSNNQNVWINILIVERLSKRLWKVQDLMTRRFFELSVAEIVPWGVDKFTEAVR